MSDNHTDKDSASKPFRGENATVRWHKELCIHVAECGRAKGDLFEAGRTPWCDPDTSSNEHVLDVVRRCPSGALSAEFADGESGETAPERNTVTVVYKGPLMFHGELQIDGAPASAPGLAFRAALCRCGLSSNKPWCDNSHTDWEDGDYGAVGDKGSALEEQGGPLDITFAENGPIRLKGNLDMISGSGRLAWQGTSTALCRCGHSKNKPFCDGSHKQAGFSSE